MTETQANNIEQPPLSANLTEALERIVSLNQRLAKVADVLAPSNVIEDTRKDPVPTPRVGLVGTSERIRIEIQVAQARFTTIEMLIGGPPTPR
jgi:hypothetical protein